MPTWKVPAGEKGKGFLLYRQPHKTAVDPETGEMYDDLLVIITPTEVEKQALVEDASTPFFTIDHFRNYNAVLVQQSRARRAGARRPGRDHHRRLGHPGAEAAGARAPRRWLTRAGPPDDRARAPVAGRPSGRTAVDPARLAAYDVLKAVRVDDAYTNLVLPSVLRQHGLSGRDAAFATELVVGHAPPARAPTTPCSPRAWTGRSRRSRRRCSTRCGSGAHQLLSMRVPDPRRDQHHRRPAAGPGRPGAGRLRQRRAAPGRPSTTSPGGYAGSRPTRPRTRSASRRSPTATRAGWSRSCRRAVGADELDALLAADNEPPRVVLVARPGRSTREELPGHAHPVLAVRRGAGGRRPRRGRRRSPRGGPASRTRARSWSRSPWRARRSRARTERWLDLCAGPGGKAALLAALAAERGADLLAAERSRTGRGWCAGRWPARTASGAWWRPTAPAPPGRRDVRPGPGRRALLGPGRAAPAPRVALAAQSRGPRRLVPLQRALLESALDSVRPGGVVVYATCSPVLAETAEVVTAVVGSRDDVVARGRRGAAAGGAIRRRAGSEHPATLATPAQTDAMFIAILRQFADFPGSSCLIWVIGHLSHGRLGGPMVQ